ncbi:hypothetical protein ACFL4K_02070 [Candidatus Neomarinimicrobiota bacterium]
MRGTPANLPDVSLVGDITGKLTGDEDDYNRNKILIREIEFALQGYLYPEMRADVFMAFHRHEDQIEAEICQGYASFLNLPGGFGLIVGKKHVDFGKVNKVCQHHVPYVERPLVLSTFFGGEGLEGEGASIDCLLPLPFFLQLGFGTWIVEGEDEAEGEEEFGMAGNVHTTRAWMSFPLGASAELEIGGSGAFGNGPQYEENKDDVTVLGVDLTYKAWPTAYQRLTLQGEALFLTRDLPAEKINRIGLYGYLGYRFTKYWDAGILLDWTENADLEKDLTKKISAAITNHLTETTMVRFQYGYGLDAQQHEAIVQLIFGIGPHSHPLE